MNDERLTDELAKVIWDPERARDIAIAAGFGPGSVTVMKIPQVFWSRIAESAWSIVELRRVVHTHIDRRSVQDADI